MIEQPTIQFPEHFPTLQSSRISLKRMEMDDAASLYRLRSSAEFMTFLGRPLMKDTHEARQYIQRTQGGWSNQKGINWKICHKDSGDFMGYCGFWEIDYQHFKTEIGYGLDPVFQGNGYMKEALSVMTHFMFHHLNLHFIKAEIDPQNIPSKKVLESVGFTKYGYATENYFYQRFMDSEYYELLARSLTNPNPEYQMINQD